jgi:hypothetical protein
MKKLIFLLCLIFIGCDSPTTSNSQIDKILRAKSIVKSMVKHPDTLVFKEFETNVVGDNVSLTFSCKNGFGVPETHTVNVLVD